MTENDNLAELLFKIRPLLHSDGLSLTEGQMAQLRGHVALIREWNPVASLVSVGDLQHLWERHVLDSLSLGAVIQRLGFAGGSLLDIGSGGGFPAIPIRILLPDLMITLVERSEKKIGFLRKVVGALGLSGVKFLVGEYPRVAASVHPDVITSRAVENPDRLAKNIASNLRDRMVYFSQSGANLGAGFSAEGIVDVWTEAGLRRGSLELVRRACHD